MLEFAYLIKASEEATRDCDYAERIVKTSYDVFKDIIGYRASPTATPETFVNIYKQQLQNVFVSLAESKTLRELGAECGKFLEQLVGWFESQNCYVIEPLVDEGSNEVHVQFKVSSFDKVESAVNTIINDAKKKAKEKTDKE